MSMLEMWELRGRRQAARRPRRSRGLGEDVSAAVAAGYPDPGSAPFVSLADTLNPTSPLEATDTTAGYIPGSSIWLDAPGPSAAEQKAASDAYWAPYDNARANPTPPSAPSGGYLSAEDRQAYIETQQANAILAAQQRAAQPPQITPQGLTPPGVLPQATTMPLAYQPTYQPGQISAGVALQQQAMAAQRAQSAAASAGLYSSILAPKPVATKLPAYVAPAAAAVTAAALIWWWTKS